MLFFLRCAFWLSIVYASMSWSDGALGTYERGGGVAASPALVAMTDTAITGLSDFCKREPAACLAETARLTAMVNANATAADRERTAAAIVGPAVVQMLARDPRRHSRGAMLARTP